MIRISTTKPSHHQTLPHLAGSVARLSMSLTMAMISWMSLCMFCSTPPPGHLAPEPSHTAPGSVGEVVEGAHGTGLVNDADSHKEGDLSGGTPFHRGGLTSRPIHSSKACMQPAAPMHAATMHAATRGRKSSSQLLSGWTEVWGTVWQPIGKQAIPRGGQLWRCPHPAAAMDGARHILPSGAIG